MQMTNNLIPSFIVANNVGEKKALKVMMKNTWLEKKKEFKRL